MSNAFPHFCDQLLLQSRSSNGEQQQKAPNQPIFSLTRETCCHFVRLLNDTGRFPLCDSTSADGLNTPSGSIPILQEAAITQSPPQENFSPPDSSQNQTTVSTILRLFPTPNNSYTNTLPPISSRLRVEPFSMSDTSLSREYEELANAGPLPEEHATFLFGIVMMISVAVICTMLLMRLTKASGGGGGELERRKGARLMLAGVGRAASSAPHQQPHSRAEWGGGGGNSRESPPPGLLSWDYDFMVWMPPPSRSPSYGTSLNTFSRDSHHHHRHRHGSGGGVVGCPVGGPLMVLVGAAMGCGRVDARRQRSASRSSAMRRSGSSQLGISPSLVSHSSSAYSVGVVSTSTSIPSLSAISNNHHQLHQQQQRRWFVKPSLSMPSTLSVQSLLSPSTTLAPIEEHGGHHGGGSSGDEGGGNCPDHLLSPTTSTDTASTRLTVVLSPPPPPPSSNISTAAVAAVEGGDGGGSSVSRRLEEEGMPPPPHPPPPPPYEELEMSTTTPAIIGRKGGQRRRG